MLLSTLNRRQQESFICLAHSVVVSDGDLSPGEQGMLDDMRREMALPESVEACYLNIKGMDEVFDTKQVRAVAMIALIRLAYADGAFEIEEQCFLRDLSRAFELSNPDFELIDNWVGRLLALEREAFEFM
jgi:tellurite resistance protein